MRLFHVFLFIAIVLTVLGVLGFIGSPDQDLNRVIFPGEAKKLNDVATRDAYVGGRVAATGEGDFIITSSTVESIPVGTKWLAKGTEKVTWGQSITVKKGAELSVGELECILTVPDVSVTQLAKVEGYLSIECTAAAASIPKGGAVDSLTFQTVQGRVESERFDLYLYPLEQRTVIKVYSIFKIVGALAIVAWLLTMGFFFKESRGKSQNQ